MATQVQFRGGTTVEHSTFTGAAREITIDTDKDTVVVHDGATAGGYPLAKEDGATFINVDINSGTIDGTTIGATTPSTVSATDLTATGTTTLAGADTSADITFGDNVKATFGIGNDLQIYHDGSNSYVTDQGTGNLRIMASNLRIGNAAQTANYILANDGGGVTLNYSGSSKFVTTSTGIDVTGTVTADGLTVDGDINAITDAVVDIFMIENDTTDLNTLLRSNAGDFSIRTSNDAKNTLTQRLNIDHSTGDISFYEDTGTTAKFFWDASAESLGIGTSSPVSISGYSIITANNATNGGGLYLQNNGSNVARFLNTSSAAYMGSTGAYPLILETNAAERLRITSSGLVGIGTSSPSTTLHVNGDANIGLNSGIPTGGTSITGHNTGPILSIGGTDTSLTTGEISGSVAFITSDTSYTSTYSDGITGEIASVAETSVAGGYGLAFYTGVTTGTDRAERVRIDMTGDVGIGTSSPSQKLHVQGDAQVNGYIFQDNGTNAIGLWGEGNADMRFGTNNAERMRIDSSGNVGIGTSSPSYTLSVVKNTTGVNAVDILNSTTGAGSSRLIVRNNSDTNGNGFQIINNANDGVVNLLNYKNTPLAFWTNATERMRIDSSGNLLVGTTDSSVYNNGTNTSADTGINLNTTYAGFARYNGTPMYVNRTGSDGDIITFNKSGTRVGGIGTNGPRPIFVTDNGSSGSGFYLGVNVFLPTNRLGALSDNTNDLGQSNYRWDDVYATNGTIQTSDQNEKQQIASLTDAEMTAAKAISKLFKTFKWNDSVAEKGDAARTHTGVIAQEVEQAMTDAGLNAGDYAFFISTTWWETQTEVPAVAAVEAQDAVYEDVIIPAVEEVLDEEGNVVTEAQPERTEQRLVSEAVEAVEGKEAYTRTDTYETAEEAPEGATERNRKGIRYPQLLSFIGAATEQRLASIESRLDALEGL